MRSLIVGYGEIGKALASVLEDNYPVFRLDIEDGQRAKIDDVGVMHICFPYSIDFEKQIKDYQKLFKPKYTIIHSTVPVGTSRKCNATHSPVIGKHPFLESSIKTFTKFLGGEQSSELADYFRRAGVHTYLFDKPETTELFKILDTTFYGLEVEFVKEVKRLCDKYALPFEGWTVYNNAYNKGYQALGHEDHTRPNLIPIMKKIGGHCVLSNTSLLESKFTSFLKELNNGK